MAVIASSLLLSMPDAMYTDPLGELPQRPRTAARTKPVETEDEFQGAELGELLPD